MHESLRLGLYAIPAFLLLMAVEFLSYRREKEAKADRAGVSARDTATSLSIYAIGQLSNPLNYFIQLPVVVIAAACAPHPLSSSDWRVWVAALVLADLAYYAQHRMGHRVRLLWAGHSVHHSSRHFNLSTAVRLPWLIPGSFLTAVADIPLALIGIPAWMIFLAHSIVLLFQYPLAPPCPPWRQQPLPGQELRRNPHRLGPAVRQLRGGDRARQVRLDHEHRHPQSGQGQLPRVHRDAPRHPPPPHLARPSRIPLRSTRLA